jgi:hypothetical protein
MKEGQSEWVSETENERDRDSVYLFPPIVSSLGDSAFKKKSTWEETVFVSKCFVLVTRFSTRAFIFTFYRTKKLPCRAHYSSRYGHILQAGAKIISSHCRNFLTRGHVPSQSIVLNDSQHSLSPQKCSLCSLNLIPVQKSQHCESSLRQPFWPLEHEHKGYHDFFCVPSFPMRYYREKDSVDRMTYFKVCIIPPRWRHLPWFPDWK